MPKNWPRNALHIERHQEVNFYAVIITGTIILSISFWPLCICTYITLFFFVPHKNVWAINGAPLLHFLFSGQTPRRTIVGLRGSCLFFPMFVCLFCLCAQIFAVFAKPQTNLWLDCLWMKLLLPQCYESKHKPRVKCFFCACSSFPRVQSYH